MKLSKNQINKIKDILITMLRVNIANLEYQKSVSKVKKHRQTFDNLIEHTNKSISLIRNCKHYDIIADLYNSFVGGKETFYIALSECVYKNVEKWDTSEEGYQEFIRLQKEAIEKSNAEEEEKQRMKETFENARKQGKKVEWMYADGHIKPVIVEEKPN